MSTKVYIYDCLSGKLRVSTGAFMPIGRADGNVFRCRMKADSGGSLALRGGQCIFFPHGSISSYSLNGVRQNKEALVQPGMLNLFVLAGGCFVCWIGEDSMLPDFSCYNPQEWYVYDRMTSRWLGPVPLAELPTVRATVGADSLAIIGGMTSCAFLLNDLMEVAEFVTGEPAAPAAPRPDSRPIIPASGNGAPSAPAQGSSEVCCPHCWQRFRLAHALAIAAHPKLKGDSILGEKAPQRFTPTKMDAQGFPVDAMGVSVREYACPWCHHKLPPFFMRTAQHVFSLIGMPGAGKTYFLACLLHELEYTLPREFGIAFRDADPASNAPLNAMAMKLFTAARPQEAFLEKTRPQGPLYHRVWKGGRFSTLPRPFIYNISRSSKTSALIFYDTAGESCEPSLATGQEPGAGHLSAASAIFFFFDPTSDSAFRKLLGTKEDSRGRRGHMQERQALLLSETEMRLRTELHLPPDQKLDVPLAVIIGKSDTWQTLLGPEPLLPSVRNGQFQPKFVEANSKRLRQLLFGISPQICINAEAISSCVSYFDVSSFGAPPETYRDEETGEERAVPSGGKIRPTRVADPILWALHCKEPELLKKPKA